MHIVCKLVTRFTGEEQDVTILTMQEGCEKVFRLHLVFFSWTNVVLLVSVETYVRNLCSTFKMLISWNRSKKREKLVTVLCVAAHKIKRTNLTNIRNPIEIWPGNDLKKTKNGEQISVKKHQIQNRLGICLLLNVPSRKDCFDYLL